MSLSNSPIPRLGRDQTCIIFSYGRDPSVTCPNHLPTRRTRRLRDCDPTHRVPRLTSHLKSKNTRQHVTCRTGLMYRRLHTQTYNIHPISPASTTTSFPFPTCFLFPCACPVLLWNRLPLVSSCNKLLTLPLLPHLPTSAGDKFRTFRQTRRVTGDYEHGGRWRCRTPVLGFLISPGTFWVRLT